MTVPADSSHNIINTFETEDLKLYIIYSPAHHKYGIVRPTKKEAMENEEDFDDQTTE
jgi:mannose-6-phosphate isomerase-like protein (cupin superfamily)